MAQEDNAVGIDGLVTPDMLLEQRRVAAAKEFDQLQQTEEGQSLLHKTTGNALGTALRNIAVSNGWAVDPEMEKATRTKAALDKVDSEWQDDPEKSDFANAAAKQEAYSSALHADLTPAQRFQASARRLALQSQDYNLQRLKAQDQRATTAAQDDHTAAGLDFKIKEIQNRVAQNQETYGDTGTVNVYKDKQTGDNVTAPKGSDKERAFLAHPELFGYMGTSAQLETRLLERAKLDVQDRRYKTAQERADAAIERTQRQQARKAFTAQERQNYVNVNKAAGILQQLGQLGVTDKGFEGAQGASGVRDIIQDWAAGHLSSPLYTFDVSKTAALQTVIDSWRQIGTTLLKGNQSDLDQKVFDAINISRPDSVEKNTQKLALAYRQTLHIAEMAYIDAQNRVGEDFEAEIPEAILSTLVALGKDPSTIGDRQTVNAEWKADRDKLLAQLTASNSPGGSANHDSAGVW